VQESRRLVIVRHAKAEAQGSSDHERRLADRGHDDAVAGGAWLASAGIVPDHALVSTALRAQETYAALSEGAGWGLEPDASRALYVAEPETALDLVREAPDDATTVVVVGHNPTMATLAQLLDDGEGDPAASADMLSGGLPTCSLVVFEVDGAWAELAFTGARLTRFHVGRA
jgi:phosphohistidine phosphatase